MRRWIFDDAQSDASNLIFVVFAITAKERGTVRAVSLYRNKLVHPMHVMLKGNAKSALFDR
jgi:hypothetical protein